MGSITAKELARLLHLSESAVSLALNDRPGVSRETRKRVLEAAREHDFDFSRKAMARDQKKGTICFAVYRKSGAVVGDTPFFSELTDGVSIRCRLSQWPGRRCRTRQSCLSVSAAGCRRFSAEPCSPLQWPVPGPGCGFPAL